MTESELIVQTVANGERLQGRYDYERLRWIRPPRLLVMEIGAE